MGVKETLAQNPEWAKGVLIRNFAVFAKDADTGKGLF